jgi:hypothetical protein
MSAQIIKLSDRRKARPKPLPNLTDLPLSILAAYAAVGLESIGRWPMLRSWV